MNTHLFLTVYAAPMVVSLIASGAVAVILQRLGFSPWLAILFLAAIAVGPFVSAGVLLFLFKGVLSQPNLLMVQVLNWTPALIFAWWIALSPSLRSRA